MNQLKEWTYDTKRKSIRIVSKYITNQNKWYLENLVDGLRISQAKNCALIAVDEIAKCTKYEKQKFENDRFSEDYWQEVKEEIESL